jgi:alkaline phosphatase
MKMQKIIVGSALATLLLSAGWTPMPAMQQLVAQPAAPFADKKTGSVIFIHPDGAGMAAWEVLRAIDVGPDAELNWDKLPHIAVYNGPMSDSLTASSNGGATAHATGIRAEYTSFGLRGDGSRIVDAKGESLSVMRQALRAGLPTALVQSGSVIEPGTACFVAEAPRRDQYDLIAEQVIESGVDLILGGGEQHYLPKGIPGRHGVGERKDQKNLIDRAKSLGYTVVYTRDELAKLPTTEKRVLGVFADLHTFNDRSEEQLAIAGLPLYYPDAPTIGEMTEYALRNLAARGQRFMLVVEEEGSDNFGNNTNAAGMIEALRRADAALGAARQFVAQHPQTLLITCCDSDAGGMRMNGIPMRGKDAKVPATLPAVTDVGSPIDGVAGTGSAPFMARPDRFGKSLPFFISWAHSDDVSGGILVRAEGFNAENVKGTFSNTDVAELMRETLFAGEMTKGEGK